MKKFLSLVALSTFSLACNPISGQLKVLKSFDAIQTGFFGNKSALHVNAGTYNARVEFESASKVILKLDVGNIRSDHIDLNIPQGKFVNNYSGPISLKAKESGQSFDVKGNIDTNESDTGTTSTTESCSRTETVQRCGSHPGGPTECRTETVTISGIQQVQYHYHDSYTSLDLKLVSASGATIATFKGSRSGSNKIYDYQGGCY